MNGCKKFLILGHRINKGSIMRFIISLGLVILLTSCAGTTGNYYTSTVNSWRGGSAASLIAQWGTPDTKIVNPNGSVIYIYKTKSYDTASTSGSSPVGVNVSRTGRPVIVTPNNANISRSALSIHCLAVFEADAKGKIYNTEVRGQGCYGSQNFVKTKGNPAKYNR
jgi:hypothetical protein